MRALTTYYNGYKFRSRLEARWAYFFDLLGIAYKYELQGYEVAPGMFYLPDFYLTEHDTYLEVKPYPATQEEIDKIYNLCLGTARSAIITEGDPYLPRVRTYAFCKWNDWPPRDLALVKEDLEARGIDFDIEHIDERGFCRSTEHTLAWAHPKYPNPDLWSPVDYDITSAPDRGAAIPAMIKARQARFEHGETPA